MKPNLQDAEPKDGTNHELSFCGHVKSGDDWQRKAKNYNIENQARPNLRVAHYGGIKPPDKHLPGSRSPDEACRVALEGDDLKGQRQQ